MKKLLLLIACLGIASMLAWKLFSGHDPKPAAEQRDQPLAIHSQSSVFGPSFNALLAAYYSLSEALADSDTLKANRSALVLQHQSDSLPFSGLQGDSSVILTAKNLATSMSHEAEGFLGESSLEQKRRSFNMLTDELYNFIRAIRYDGSKIFYVQCPLAFQDSTVGYWLSSKREPNNPYLGKSSASGGQPNLGGYSVVDSLDFSQAP